MGVHLSKRLAQIANLVPLGSVLADVGSDHAYLPISLIQNHRIEHAQAIDNKKGPYLRMKENVEKEGLSQSVSCSLSSGLDELDPKANCLALCGMGGLLVCSILEKHLEKLDPINTLIIDAHKDVAYVRKMISSFGYHLTDEKIIYEDKIYYSLMKWSKGAPEVPYDEEELYFGPINMEKREEGYLDYLRFLKEMNESLLTKDLSPKKREDCLSLLRRIEKQL